jgi:hypothetical protein
VAASTSDLARPSEAHKRLAQCIFLLLLQSQVVHAHHSFATHYRYDEQVEISGVITEFQLANPHSFMHLEVSLGNGETEMWEVEANSVLLLRRANITTETFRVGDRVTITGMRSLDPERLLMFGKVGQTESGDVYNFIRPDWDKPAAPITLVRGLAETLDVSRLEGVWRRVIREGEIMNLLGESPLPLNDEGLRARANYNPLESKYKDCLPIDIPSLFYIPYLLEIEADDEAIRFHNEYFNILRQFTPDGNPRRAHTTEQYGVSNARIEGDELIIETTGFPASQAGLGGDFDPLGKGKHIPSSEGKRLAESYRLMNNNEILEVSLVLSDPKYLVEPYEATLIWARAPEDSELTQFECDLDIARRSTSNAVPDR